MVEVRRRQRVWWCSHVCRHHPVELWVPATKMSHHVSVSGYSDDERQLRCSLAAFSASMEACSPLIMLRARCNRIGVFLTSHCLECFIQPRELLPFVIMFELVICFHVRHHLGKEIANLLKDCLCFLIVDATSFSMHA